MAKFKITITDEFNCNYVYESTEYLEIVNIVNDWLANYDETPLYSIFIDIEPL